jgi:hypothetical protein
MAKREGELKKSSETKGSNEGVGSHYFFFCIRKDIKIYIYKRKKIYMYMY